MHKSRTILNASTMVTGTGWLFATDILKRENGWHYTLMAEDSEFTVAQVIKGEKSVYCHDAIFYDEQPITFSQSWKQRKRWLRGTAQVAEKYGKGLFKGIFTNKGNRFACYDLLLSLSAATHLTAFAFITGILGCIYNMITAQSFVQALAVAGAYVGGLYVAFLIMGAIPVLACRKRIPLSFAKIALYLLMFPIFMASYLPLALVAIFSKKVEWVPIEHGICDERKLYM